ncbi:MAG TPA: sigma-70 family RNA polymerase sigma factor [Polyangiaceae bacterium]|nr:sigma-70 family RNA polymerase sigma factor [Polyangiaceae bacterium]
MNTANKPAWDYFTRNYREPKTDDPIERWLPHPEVAKGICGVLVAYGYTQNDLQDGLQDVYLKALRAFRRIKPPADLPGMRALCRKMARDMAIDRLRKAGRRERDFVGLCEEPDEFTPLECGAERRDPVDAGRQLEVLAQLFREGCMPEGGVDILEGVASRCTYKEVAEAHGITDELARWRMREMCRIYRTRMAKLGMLPGMMPLRVLVSMPTAIPALREAA